MFQVDKAKAKLYSESLGWKTVELIPKPFVWKKEFEKKNIKFLMVENSAEQAHLRYEMNTLKKQKGILWFGIILLLIALAIR